MEVHKSLTPKIIKYTLGALVVLYLCGHLLFVGFYLNVADLEIKVIDSATKKPIDNVILVAHWEKWTSGMGGSNPAGLIEIKESVGGENGLVGYKGWQEWFPEEAFPPQYSPTLVLLAENYKGRILYNYGYKFDNRYLVGDFQPRGSKWNGMQVEMDFIGDDPEKFFDQNLELFKNIPNSDRNKKTCIWDKTPNTFILDKRMMLRMRKSSYSRGELIRSLESNYKHRKNCNSFDKIVEKIPNEYKN